MKLAILALIIQVVSGQQKIICQNINWARTTDWRIYMPDAEPYHISLDSVLKLRHQDMELDSIHLFLQNSIQWPKEAYATWQGAYICTAKLESGQMIELIVSVYGGFFLNPSSHTYYEVPNDIKRRWINFFHKSLELIK